jgi:hypothetical protein
MSRINEARNVAKELLESLETSQVSVDKILMKAKRLARLMRDADAQVWLDLETRGYPDNFIFTELGNCQQYAKRGGRITPDGKYYLVSLPNLEAQIKSDEAIVDGFRTSKYSTSAKDYVEAGATSQLNSGQIQLQIAQKDTYANNQSLFISMKSAIHNYATDVFLAIELGDVAQDIFEDAREKVDVFVRVNCPKAAEQLIAINERMQENLPESRSAALTSCRRLLMTVADAIFPPQPDDWKDSKGKLRKVGTEEYKNRLLAFADRRIDSNSSYSILTSEIEHLSARVDAVYEKVSKGVHTEVSTDEARLAVIQTYLFIGEIARLNKEPIKNDAG